MTAPLTNLDRQQAFDTMLTHLREQKVPATSASGSCLYRTKTGLKCAVGALIPDDLYRKEFDETWSFDEITRELGVTDVRDIDFLKSCQQQMHDYPSIQCDIGNSERYLPKVEEGAVKVARQYGLIYTPPVNGMFGIRDQDGDS